MSDYRVYGSVCAAIEVHRRAVGRPPDMHYVTPNDFRLLCWEMDEMKLQFARDPRLRKYRCVVNGVPVNELEVIHPEPGKRQEQRIWTLDEVIMELQRRMYARRN